MAKPSMSVGNVCAWNMVTLKTLVKEAIMAIHSIDAIIPWLPCLLRFHKKVHKSRRSQLPFLVNVGKARATQTSSYDSSSSLSQLIHLPVTCADAAPWNVLSVNELMKAALKQRMNEPVVDIRGQAGLELVNDCPI